MSSAGQKAFDTGRSGGRAQEPSMEEILASIRRIISDEPSPQPAAAPEPEPEPELAPQAYAAPEPEPEPEPQQFFDDASAFGEQSFGEDDAAPEEDVLDLADMEESEPEPAPFVPPQPAPRLPESRPMTALRTELEDRLLSPATDATVSSAFNSLAGTILSSNARTLEDLVREMLKPMLKSWLDDNLPILVERLVRAEIERVARGGR
jgi:cell pole-organizing protein PopZ